MQTTTLLLNALDDAKVTGCIGPQTEAEFLREYIVQTVGSVSAETPPQRDGYRGAVV